MAGLLGFETDQSAGWGAITIDAAGRIVVPKAIRTRLGLEAGSRLLLREEAGNRLVLEPVSDAAVPVEADGILVIRGRLVGEIPDHRAQRAQRVQYLGRVGR
jgi:AbrB family looped-hinge helix DNA binding protein